MSTRILMFIDHFGSGGAQRQIVNLAVGLKHKGHSVDFFTYYPQYDFFSKLLIDNEIKIHSVSKGKGFSVKVLVRLCKLIKKNKYTTVISFLEEPNIYAQFAKCFTFSKFYLICSERSNYMHDSQLFSYLKVIGHFKSDKIVSNSNTQNNWLNKFFWLKFKTKVIYNGVEEVFYQKIPEVNKNDEVRLLIIGRVGPEKNLIFVIKALNIFYSRFGYVPNISCIGRLDMSDKGKKYCEKLFKIIDESPLIKDKWHWVGETKDVYKYLNSHHALLHASLYEGLPNVICEALMAGRPVIASNVCDHPILVSERNRGYLFDPNKPESLVNAIKQFIDLNNKERESISFNCRDYATKNLGIKQLVNSFDDIIR